MNQLKTILLFGVLSALLIGVGGAFAPQHLAVFVVLAAVMNLGTYFFSDRIVLAMYRAREVSEREAPELHRIVRELAEAADLPMPRVCMSRWFSTHPPVEERVARLRSLPIARRPVYGH